MPAIRLRLAVPIVFLLISVAGYGQTPPSNPPGGPPGVPTAPDRGLPPRKPPEFVRPLFVSGRVVLDDGTAPSEPVVIERVCNSGNARREGFTDPAGYFSLRLGSDQGGLPDASSSGLAKEFDDGASNPALNFDTGPDRKITTPPLMGCELRASLAGYVSSTISLHNRQPLDNPEVGTLVLYPIKRIQGDTVSTTDLQAPKAAKKEREKAQKLGPDNPERAEVHLRKAVELYPQYASAWFELGLLLEGNQRTEEARAAYRESVGADPKFVRPYVQLAGLASLEKKWQECADLSAKVVELSPFAFPHAYLMNAMANYHLQKLDLAEASARKVRLLDTEQRLPVAHLLLGTLLLRKQDYLGAAEGFRAFLKAAPESPDAPAIRQQLAEIEKKLAETSAKPVPPPR